ncbi:thiamine pyrophosphate-dependent enzyme, partial [Rhizobiaceae sp. 2RAB30]
GSRAVDRARRGEGPTLLELKTYRWGGHFEGDPKKYRSKEEEREWKARCPLARFRKILVGKHKASFDQLEAMEAKVASEVAEAIQFALESPLPEPATALEHVYAA